MRGEGGTKGERGRERRAEQRGGRRRRGTRWRERREEREGEAQLYRVRYVEYLFSFDMI